MPTYLVLSCSLDPQSRSRVMARIAHEYLAEAGHQAEFVDLVEYPLPMCDGEACYGDERVRSMAQKIRDADGILIAAPVYNYDVNAAAKNVVELTGRAWSDKVVGFLLAAGGRSSYMSVTGLANSLMLDFHSFVLPRFVYATGDAFTDDRMHDEKTHERIRALTEALARVTSALK